MQSLGLKDFFVPFFQEILHSARVSLSTKSFEAFEDSLFEAATVARRFSRSDEKCFVRASQGSSSTNGTETTFKPKSSRA